MQLIRQEIRETLVRLLREQPSKIIGQTNVYAMGVNEDDSINIQVTKCLEIAIV